MPKQFDELRRRIASDLAKRFPKLTPNEIESRSYAVATSVWKKRFGRLPKRE